jgi:GMP synthase-like glutamine amidotransferase
MAAAVVLQTQANCPPGLLSDWAAHRGITLDLVRADRWERLPPAAGYELAVILGSTASLAQPPEGWVARVLEWVIDADRADVAILGICFGAQALAAALGGRVFALPEPEQGWIEVRTHDARVPGGPWLAVHNDGIEVPPGAAELADNPRGVQAFAAGRHLGVQFHPEVTPAIVARWVSEYPDSVDRRLLVDLSLRCTCAAPGALSLFDRFADAAARARPPLGVPPC